MKNYVLLFACITLLRADNSLSDPELLANTELYGPTRLSNGEDLFPIPEQCSEIVDLFAEYASNLTKCSIQHSRPVTLCKSCVEQYIKFSQKYQELVTTDVNGTTCKSIFISHDRLDAVLEFHDNIAAIWLKGNCESCFNWSNSTIKLSNSTEHFIKLYNDTNNCINKFKNFYNNSDEVCEKCMQFYLDLDEYYKSLSPDTIGLDSICMDIVDSMNTTRYIWSKTYQCCKHRQTPEVIFLCSTGIISFLPILYYLAVRFCGPIRDLPEVLRQSRFKQKILRSVHGNNN